MSHRLRIDFVGPPFAGHLFPLLQMAGGLRERGYTNLRFFSTEQARAPVEMEHFPFHSLLDGSSHKVFQISDTAHRVGSNPIFLLKQLRTNLSLMDQMRTELEHHWRKERPDLVIADLTVPVAGLLAQSLGIRWWTSTPTPCVVETGDGVPAYLGGWRPRSDWIGKIRDAGGRGLTRFFKQSIHRLFRRKMTSLGVDRIYRDDGYETVFSPEMILGLGVREFEFPRNWPPAMRFVGPLTASPILEHEPPEFVEGRPHVLISLGTHLWWAKEEAKKLLQSVAQEMPDFVFHFTYGSAISPDQRRIEKTIEGNFHTYGYLPYQLYADRYQVALNHGGTGVLYRCLGHGIPILAWPQDYDQFDHTARLVEAGLGKRCIPRKRQVIEDLRYLATDATVRANVERFQAIIQSYRTCDLIEELLQAINAPS